MKTLILAASVLALSLCAPAYAADVGVSVSIGQPGFYGCIDIGGYPQPQVIYQQPRTILRGYENREPIYMRVPPGHAKNWRKYCGRYNACNQRVYFVQDNWYNHEYAPRYQEQHRDQRNENRDHRKNKNSGNHGNDHRNGNNNGHNKH
jgi:hypothetical protein